MEMCRHWCSVFWGNLRRNWYFPISAAAFFYLNAVENSYYIPGLILCLLAALYVGGNLPEDREPASRLVRVLALLACGGMLLFSWERFQLTWADSGKAAVLGQYVPFLAKYWKETAAAAALLSVPFLYSILLGLWKYILRVLWSDRYLKGAEKEEWIVYTVLSLLISLLVVLCFRTSSMFYDSNQSFDLVYTSDSTELLLNNAFLNLTHGENDIRQPLFALYSSPASGILYLVGAVTNLGPRPWAVLNGVCQALLLLLTNFLLASILGARGRGRAAAVAVLSSLYASMLFSVVVEQYAVAYFWLIMLVSAMTGREDRTLPLCAAGGALLTSVVMAVPGSPWREPRRFVRQMFSYGVWFGMMIFLLGRYDVFTGIMDTVIKLRGFMGESVALSDKVLQYISFVGNCFLAPNAAPAANLDGMISWQLCPVEGVSWLGLGILALCVAGFVRGRRDSLCRIAMYWVIFSVLILVVAGWGTAENGLILYALYFAWAYFVLMYRLVEGLKLPVCWRGTLVLLTLLGLLLINGNAMAQLVRFGAVNYPG